MIFIACAVFDNKVKAFMPPFFQVNEAVAKRSFGDVANNYETAIGRNPDDYCLYVIGTFDDNTGELRSFPQHINLGLASLYRGNTVTLPLENQHVRKIA